MILLNCRCLQEVGQESQSMPSATKTSLVQEDFKHTIKVDEYVILDWSQNECNV